MWSRGLSDARAEEEKEGCGKESAKSGSTHDHEGGGWGWPVRTPGILGPAPRPFQSFVIPHGEDVGPGLVGPAVRLFALHRRRHGLQRGGL